MSTHSVIQAYITEAPSRLLSEAQTYSHLYYTHRHTKTIFYCFSLIVFCVIIFVLLLWASFAVYED